MNFDLTYKVKEAVESKGYTVNADSSKSSDYLKITKDSDKYGFKLVVRFSDHDAMTGRAACADLHYISGEINKGEWNGEFESMYGFDEDGDFDTTGEFYYESESKLYEIALQVILAEINNKLDF